VNFRVGHGWDLHRLAAGRPCVIGGITIPHAKGPMGHSDGDVLLHALADALLGAAALGDIGTLFPDTDERWRGADSGGLLKEVVSRVAAAGWRVANADATVVAQEPRIGPHREAIRARVTDLLGADVSAVSVKAKTAEGLGDIGAGEAIACHAVVLLETL
jgi:2-C-methyl-D-erythritol 2,4-cyclodiphosphate synthase